MPKSTPISEIFGKPNEGIHAYRFGGLAIVDVIMTIIFIILIYPHQPLSPVALCIVVLICTILIHKLFGVKTALNNALGL